MSSKSPESEELIDNFIDELWLERGLSKNTLSAYRQDISSFNKCAQVSYKCFDLIANYVKIP